MSSGAPTLGGIRRLGAVQLHEYTVATAPSAAKLKTGVIYVSNGAAGNPVVAFSNGADWLRCDTLVAISAS